MSDPAAAAGLGEIGVGSIAPGALTPERIDAVLADFRGWLLEMADGRCGQSPPPAEPPEVDLAAVVAQVAALRHEVNLQTKASRTAVDQTAEALKLAANPKPGADPDEAVRPLVKALIDIADALAGSLKQVAKARDAAEGAFAKAAAAPPPARRGWLARWFTPTDMARPPANDHSETFGFLRDVTAGVADGYALSLRRVERVLPQFGLEPVECVGRPFDPELMEVVEAADGDGRPSGTVVEEVRRGYRWNGKPFRFAQVKVAR